MSTAAPSPAVGPDATSIAERARELDAALVRRWRAGDQRAWTELVDRFSSYVYAIAARFVRGDDRAQDVSQEVFGRVYTRLDSLHDDGALKPWVVQLTCRTAIDRLRADAREPGARWTSFLGLSLLRAVPEG